MTILIPTKEKGATTKPTTMVYAEPTQLVTDDMLRQQLPDLGMNTAFFADLLSAMLTHERCGRHLYRSVQGRTNNPMLQAKYTSSVRKPSGTSRSSNSSSLRWAAIRTTSAPQRARWRVWTRSSSNRRSCSRDQST